MPASASKLSRIPAELMLSSSPEKFKETLVCTGGNISHAAKALNISKPYAMILTKRFGLTEYARELRAKNGFPATGRPHIVVFYADETKVEVE
jgi:hypothetical protein